MCPRTLAPVLFLLALPCAAGAAEPQPSRSSAAPAREARGDQLLALKDHVAALASDDAEAREQAQDTLIVLGATFRDEIDAALASATNLEARTRLKEILEAWDRLDSYNTAIANAQTNKTQESVPAPQTYAQRPGMEADALMEARIRGGC